MPAAEPAVPEPPPAGAIPSGPARESDLKWRRKPMVRWLSPGQLAATGVRALLSGIFGAYADRREVQAALQQLEPPEVPNPDNAPLRDLVYHYEDRGDPVRGLWLDFVADLGDGFDSTYTVAWLLAQPSLPIPQAGQSEKVHADEATATSAGRRAERGRILVMGGDQVYPTASRSEYTNRLAGPYEAAFPWTTDHPPPHLFAIPGNHDWYDGLTSFLRLFCQRRWLGGWKTQQHRSYFALQLPRRWWLLGIDVQLQSDIDQPQRNYFTQVARQMQRGDRVILCTPEPTWVHTRASPAAFDNLAFFERTVLAPRGAELALTLAGDLHHYSRYSDAVRAERSKHHKITAGGGGAYLLGTSILPDELTLTATAVPHRKPPDEPKERYTREAEYPSTARSMALKWGALTLGWKNPSFTLFLGGMYALFAWFLQSSSKLFLPLTTWGEPPKRYPDLMTFAQAKQLSEWLEVLSACWYATAHAPLVATFALLIVAALIAFCKPDVERSRMLCQTAWMRMTVRGGVGLLHGALHLALAIALIWHFSWLNLGVLGLKVDHGDQILLFVVEMAVVGGALGGILMSLFLLPGVNYNEAFASQHLESCRNFLRLHLAPDGTLTVYPYGVPRAARWRFRPNAPPQSPYFVPMKPPEVRLIDGAITLAAPQPGS